LKEILTNLKDEKFKNFLFNELNRYCMKTKDKRDKFLGQKVRFHSWGGKRNKESPNPKAVVIRTPFFPWGGK
jgi:hypothetical protein